MYSPHLSAHCKIRAKQRGIPQVIMMWLCEYGTIARQHGADIYYFDKQSRKRLKRDIGKIAYDRVSDLLDTYIVMSDEGKVITSGYRTKRIKH